LPARQLWQALSRSDGALIGAHSLPHVERPLKLVDDKRMRSYVPYALIVLLLASTIGAVAAGIECAAGRACIYMPFVGRGPGTATPTAVPVFTPAPVATPDRAPFTGLAILGDSTQDEYRADNPRGGEYGDTTFNWVELLARYRNVNVGAWGERGEPRRGGYAYNWARSGATTRSLIEGGQHTGAAGQVRASQVSHVLIQIGINDFGEGELGLAIYTGELRGPVLERRLDAMVESIRLAILSNKVAGAQVMVAPLQDYVSIEAVPEVDRLLPDPAGRQRLMNAYVYMDDRLEGIATREGAVYFDFNAALQAELRRRAEPRGGIMVGGERISFSSKGDEPHHAFLDDQYAHPGTVLSAIMANLYIERMNAAFGTTFAPFSDDEIIRIAGIRR
jgi:hypothetical protein